MSVVNRNPSFVRFFEKNEGGEIVLCSQPFELTTGHEMTISGRSYIVDHMRDDKGKLLIRNRRDDLRGNLAAFQELARIGVISDQFVLDDICLRNKVNGDVAVEVLLPGGTYSCGADLPGVEIEQQNLMLRFDASMNNYKHVSQKVDEVDIRFSPCMFGSEAAYVETLSGRKIPITERHCHIDEPVWELRVGSRMTLYEREIISRLCSTVTLLLLGGRINHVVTTLPRGAYYSFLIAPAAAGLVPPKLVLEWFDHVDARAAMLFGAMTRPLQRIHPTLNISQYSLMDQVCDVMRDYISRAQLRASPIDERELLNLTLDVLAERDPFVRFAFSLGVQRPTSFLEFADFTYAMSILPDMVETRKDPKLVVGVYDICENVLWNEARKLRNRGLLQPRGLYDPQPNTKWELDHLSYLAVMPIEQAIFELSEEFIETHMGGFERLYAMRDRFISPHDERLLFSMMGEIAPLSSFIRPSSSQFPAVNTTRPSSPPRQKQG